ncbi:hypothetical protein VNO77_43960 [Canavalia gladiata]|uniref:Uncharacterized protein n=1 Tax=Canavalia gladiata TaxID=3824 RepID=A0AAN9JV26_CANGL
MATILITSNALFRISNSFPYPSHSHKPSKITFTSTLHYSHCRSYFMFHGLDVSNAQVIFKYLPILSFTESYIYQLDNLNEKLLQKQNNEKSLFGVKDEREIQLLVSYFSNSPTRPLMAILERKGLLTKRYDYEAKCISEAEDKFNSLLKSLDPQLAERYLKRCAETNEAYWLIVRLGSLTACLDARRLVQHEWRLVARLMAQGLRRLLGGLRLDCL